MKQQDPQRLPRKGGQRSSKIRPWRLPNSQRSEGEGTSVRCGKKTKTKKNKKIWVDISQEKKIFHKRSDLIISNVAKSNMRKKN